MDTIIEEMINDFVLWNKAAVSLATDSANFWYKMVLARYETLRQEQEESKKKEK